MKKINILDSSIYNLIAAGEVVENPASVIKELVENSIDAQADSITIEIKNGGKSYIKVCDNGFGIDSQYLHTALLPHATSKISSAEDLACIGTLGFRGEALASIAAVSRLSLQSRTADEDLGYKIICEGGQVCNIEEVGSPLGTFVTVEELFFNVPARAKFLGSDKSEETKVSNLISRLILANPNISIKYIADGKTIYHSYGKGIEAAIYCIYGREAADNSCYIFNDTMPDIVIKGFVGKPQYTKPNRTYQTVIINGRYVNNDTVSLAVYNAFQDYLMKRQYPFYVLYIDIPKDLIDVNVHPGKMEVRFLDKSAIFRAVYYTIRKFLENEGSMVRSLEISQDTYKSQHINDTNNNENNNTALEEKQSASFINFTQEDSQSINKSFVVKEASSGIEAKIYDIFGKLSKMKQGEGVQNSFYDSSVFNNNKNIVKIANELIKTDNQKENDFSQAEYFSETALIGTLFDTYILIQSGDNFYMIDQHAAHERILYDKLVSLEQVDSVQPLLAPYIFSVNHIEQERIEQVKPHLQKMGFDIESFGALTYKISAVPNLLSGINFDDFIKEITAENKMLAINNIDLIKDKLKQAACKAAVKGGAALHMSEILVLLEQMRLSNTELLCPHGRPIIIKITKKEIEKWFKRTV